jgi:16S rRNA (guanine527-N7)-methyltransferase
MTEDEARHWLRAEAKVSDEQMEQLQAFVTYLKLEAQSQNLISAATFDQIWARHIADSAQLAGLAGKAAWSNWLDLGSGAGFPGLIIAILSGRPVTLVESRTRRIDYLERAIRILDLEKNVTVAGMALEKLNTAKFAVISARAFAPLPRLLNAAARFSTENTIWILPKGKNAATELAKAQQDWNLMFHVKQSITEPCAGILVGTLHGQHPNRHL